MKKKVNLVLAGLVLAGLAVFLTVEGAEAFCVENHTDAKISASQKSGGKAFREFKKNIEPGERECCSWENKDCNKEGKKDSIIRFNIAYYEYTLRSGTGGYWIAACTDFKIKAGGSIKVKGKDGKYRCEEGE